MTAPLTIYFVRHGEVHNPEGILYGRKPDYHLSATGQEQATAAAHYLADKPIVAVYASPLERAQETAHIIETAHPDLSDVFTDERLIEVHTPHDGLNHAELEKIHFDLYTGSEAPYEQPRDIRRRVLAFIADMRKKHAGETVVAVTHGDIVVALFMYTQGADENDIGRSHDTPNRIQAMGLPEIYPATASLSRLIFHTEDADEVPDYLYIRPY